jgi:hypothetical protein
VIHHLELEGLLTSVRCESRDVEIGDNRLESTQAHFRTLALHKVEIILQHDCRVVCAGLAVRELGASIHDSPVVLLHVVAVMVSC